MAAASNATANDIRNCTFVAGDIRNVFKRGDGAQYGKPRVVIVDPPRAGMHSKVVRHLVDMRPERIIYVSCDRHSLARDIALMTDTYQVDTMQPIDLFPQTYHIENVALLVARQLS